MRIADYITLEPGLMSGYPESLLCVESPFSDPLSDDINKHLFFFSVRRLLDNRRLWHFCDTGETARVKQRHPANQR